MIGQAPFVGYAVAELSAEDPEPTIDSSLAESEGKEPDWFLALASDRPLRSIRSRSSSCPSRPFRLLRSVSRTTTRTTIALPSPVSSQSGPTSGTVLINILEAEREAALESVREQAQALQAERFRADRVVQELAAAREEVELLRERCRAMDERTWVDEEARRSILETQLDRARHDPELAALRERLRSSEERVRASEERVRSSEERIAVRGRAGRDPRKTRARSAEERARGRGRARPVSGRACAQAPGGRACPVCG